jgi:MYXO-CTERM domain-containing protein
MTPTAADAGVIAAIVLGLLCLRRRRCPNDEVRREQNEILMNLEMERKPQP